MTTGPQLRIASVPWPVYKLVALAVGALAFVVVGAFTLSAGPAVLAGAATATVVWVALGVTQSSRR